MPTIRINNTQPNIKGIGYVPDPSKVDALTLKLFPGINEVDGALWERISAKDVVIASWLKDRYLVVDGDPKKGAVPFADLPADDAAMLVDITFRLDLLQNWRVQEKRGGVLAVIEKQIHRIENPGEE
jgi:hypothetical protein